MLYNCYNVCTHNKHATCSALLWITDLSAAFGGAMRCSTPNCYHRKRHDIWIDNSFSKQYKKPRIGVMMWASNKLEIVDNFAAKIRISLNIGGAHDSLEPMAPEKFLHYTA